MHSKVDLLIISIAVIIFSNGCTTSEKSELEEFPDRSILEQMVVITTDSIIISWIDTTNDSNSIKYYKLMYCVDNNNNWQPLDTNISYSARITKKIYRENFIWDSKNDLVLQFGVIVVGKNGKTSGIHTCSDITADPYPFIIRWKWK